MDNDEQRPHLISWRDLAAREVAQLAFPGSRLVHEQHRDEGEGWGQDRELKTAMLRRGYVVDADGDEVQEWFRSGLAARGWHWDRGFKRTPDRIGADFYDRGSARLTVLVTGREGDRPPHTFWPPTVQGAKGLLYDVELSDGYDVELSDGSERADGG